MYTNSVDPIICNSVLIKDIEGHILGTHLKFPRSTAANTIIKKKNTVQRRTSRPY